MENVICILCGMSYKNSGLPRMCKMLLMCLNRFPRSAFSDNTNLAFMLLETASETRQEKGDKIVHFSSGTHLNIT